jgi:hypothetical protein
LNVATVGEKELNNYNKLISPDETYKSFLNQKDQLILQYIQKDEEGKIVYLDDANQKAKLQEGKEDELKQKLENLKKKHELAIKNQEGKEAAGMKWLQEEIEINDLKINIGSFPKWSTIEMLVMFKDFLK